MMKPLDQLLTCVGEWSGSSTLQDPETGAPDESPSTAALTALLDGRFVRIDYTWSYQGAPQQGSLLLGYEAQRNVATGYWIDSWHLGDQVMASEGSVDTNGAVSLCGSYAAPPGPDWGWLTVVVPDSGRELRVTMFNVPPGGQAELAVEARYARA